MSAEELEKNLSRLGFPLMESQGTQADVSKILADVVKSDNARYWEGIPVLLVGAYKVGNLNPQEVESHLSGPEEKSTWRNLLVMSLALYRVMQRRFNFADELEKGLSAAESTLLDQLREKLDHPENFALQEKEFNPSRLKTLFDNYTQQEALKEQKSQAKHDEFSLEYALSQFFSPRQKELFKKKLSGEPFSKTEREYFSRTVKKKVLALTNPDLPRLARRVLE